MKLIFRYDNLIDLPRVRTTKYGKSTFCYEAAVVLNILPNELRKVEDFSEFRRLVHTWSGPACKYFMCKSYFFIYCLVLLQFASFLLSSMILIELSLYSAFTMMFELSVLIPSFFCMFFSRFLVFSPCFILKQLHMCCLINIMLLPLAIPFTLFTFPCFLTLSLI